MIKSWLHILRWPNLLIVLCTQLLIYGVIWVPSLKYYGLEPQLDLFHFLLLSFTTVMLAAGSYLINDLVDLEADRINRPDRMLVTEDISVTAARNAYFAFGIIGFLIAIYLAWHIQDWMQLLIYPLAWALLWGYSFRFKKMVLVGNIIVSLFVAFVPGIIIYAERQRLFELGIENASAQNKLTAVFVGYLLFAILSTLFREMIKDLEDREGDEHVGVRTAAVIWEEKITKQIAVSIGLIWLFFQVAAIGYASKQAWWATIGVLSILSIILVIILFKTKDATDKTDYSAISSSAKWLMVVGLLLLMVWKMEFLPC